ncbi:hypothetical protein [Pseudoroseicyclus sp. CXY001]|uniref:hypothetical protein n=1 Tax=Pseudoroseicyclus sp. CXY001 TaxID=3242492 RepID=UPI0035715903
MTKMERPILDPQQLLGLRIVAATDEEAAELVGRSGQLGAKAGTKAGDKGGVPI